MSILIVGSKGNMGRRYGAILNYLNTPWKGVDKDTPMSAQILAAAKSDGVIIATPTDTHYDLLCSYIPVGKPILCEKPISRDLEELEEIRFIAKQHSTDVSMIAQYSVFLEGSERGGSFYDFYKHGDDGLLWDCIQIIGLAKDQVFLCESSPIWKCKINGKKINFGLMDRAYVEYLRQWMAGDAQTLEDVVPWHYKVHKMVGEQRGGH